MPEFYGDNNLLNPGAEDGTNNWSVSSASAVSGGVSGDYCFQVDPAGSIAQSLDPTGAGETVRGVRLAGKLLPEYPLDDTEALRCKGKITITYTDLKLDFIEIPAERGFYG